jgi:glucose/arabinose dehydrogenase
VASVASPTALAFTPDGRMLITTQTGQLRVYANGSLISTPALDLASAGNFCSTSERGLLGIAVDPNFASNGYIYLYYSPRISGECKNRLSRFTMTGNTVSLASQSILIDRIPAPFGTHNAGDVHVGNDGNLYVSVGDGGGDYAGDSGSGAANDAARDMHALVGKILRITRDGGIPADNPFQGAGTTRCHQTGYVTAGLKCQEIYATGLRNPFRIALDPNATGVKIHINDVGQNTWEEIDLGAPGADYGWNVREGPCVTGSSSDCGPPPAGMTNPIYWYRQGDPSGCRAITGGAFVPAGIWPAAYTGTYLFADYVCGRIFRLDRQGDGSYLRTDFATGLGSNSAVHMAFGPHNGTQALFYTTYEDSGSVRRIEYTGSANREPFAALTASPTSGPAPLQVDFDGSGSGDPDAGDTLTYLWDFGDGATAEGTSPTISHTYTATGSFTASLRVRDPHGALSLPATRTIQPGNTAPAPVINAPADTARFSVGETVVLNGAATDAQDGSIPASGLRWRVLRHHGTSHTHPWLPDTAGNDIAISTPPPEDLATTTSSFLEIQLTATDSQGLASTVTRQFQPRLVDLTFVTEPAGLTLGINGEPITGPQTFSSWEGWTFPASAARQQDGNGAWWVFDHWSDGGAATHDVTTGASPATYTATFRPNAAPVVTGSSVSTAEDTALTIPLIASDPDGDALTRAVSRNPAKGSLGTITAGTVVYTPTAQLNGADSFEFTASDGAVTSSPATVSVDVTEVNDAPDAVNDTTSLAEDGNLLIDVRANDTKGPSNESGQTLTISSVTTPGHGTASIEGGSVRYTPVANYAGTDSFGYQVCDDGTTNGAAASLCDSATVAVTVTPVNDAPAAADDTATVAEDGNVLVAVRTNDSDVDGNPLMITAVTPGAPTNGTVAIQSGSIRYTPSPNFSGQGRFDYTISDGAGGTDVGGVVVNVTPVNDAPAAVDDMRAGTEDTQATFSGASLVANDTDIDGGALGVTAVAVRADTHGSVSFADGQVTYAPADNFNGLARFDYTVSDGAGGTDTGTVSVDVAAVNDSPLVVDDAQSTAEATPVTIDVLANDSPGPPDESAQALTVAALGVPGHGTAVPDAGKVRYTPKPGFKGADTFTYDACDSGSLCHAATVVVNVGEVNDAPIATDVSATALEDAETPIDLAAFDPEGSALSFSIVAPPEHGAVVGFAGRVLRYLPHPNYHGDDSLTFRVSDGVLQSKVATVSVTVHEVNDLPVAVPDVVRVATDAPVSVDVRANDSPGPADELRQTLRIASVGTPRSGSAAMVDGQILYTPSPTDNAPDTFTYTVCDDGRTGGLPDPRCALGTVDFAFTDLVPPVNRRAPRIVGGRRAGTVAVAEVGEWAEWPLTVRFHWLRCESSCTGIVGAAGRRYRVRLGDVGRSLRVLATVRKRFGESLAVSARTPVVASPVEIVAVRHRGVEWVLLHNLSPLRVSLRDWSLRDSRGAVQPLRGAIGPRSIRRLYTRRIWNARERVTLVLPSGRVAHECSYASPRTPVATC